MKNYKLLYFMSFLIALESCVPKKNYDLLLASKEVLQKDYDQLKDARQERQTYADSLANVSKTLTTATQEAEDWKNRYISLYTTNEQLNQEIATLRYQNEQLQTTATTRNDSLHQEIANRLKELDARERDLRIMEAEMKSSPGTINDLKRFLSDKELKIKDLNDSLTFKEQKMTDLKGKIDNILMAHPENIGRGGNINEFTTSQEQGKVYVTFFDAFLYARGSNTVNARGIDILKKLSTVLNLSPDVAIQVVGHTDSDGSAEQNWALSTARALNIVKILTANKVEGKRIMASGRGFYQAIAPNDADNKAKNSRTEIVLSFR